MYPSLYRVFSTRIREIDITIFSSVAGGIGSGLVKLSGGVVCSGCGALMINSVQ